MAMAANRVVAFSCFVLAITCQQVVSQNPPPPPPGQSFNFVADPAFLGQCCSDATNGMDMGKTCHKQYVPKPGHPLDIQCFNAFFNCCMNKKATNYCEQGKTMSKSQVQCNSTVKAVHDDAPFHLVADCCQACNDGRGVTTDTCSNDRGTGYPGVAYRTCCEQRHESSVPASTAVPDAIVSATESVKKDDDDICSHCEFGCDSSANGTKHCTCESGYELEENGHTCRDTDECKQVPSPCDLTKYDCSNFKGGHTCLEKEVSMNIICGEGFFFNSTSAGCQESIVSSTSTSEPPKNPCATKTCPNGEACVSDMADGEARCIKPLTADNCPVGQRPDEQDKTKCIPETACDINNPCKGDEDCHMNSGMPECLPKKRGRNSNPDAETEKDTTDSAGTTTTSSSSFDNDCNFGYTYNEVTKSCEDVDECEGGTAFCFDNEVCKNTNGSYICAESHCGSGLKPNATGDCVDKCDKGFRYDDVWEECKDIDECHDKPCAEDKVCKNTDGGYDCVKSTCGPGFTTSSFFSGCTDVNECDQKTDNCSANETCSNTMGGFFCDCRHGFHNVSNECVDIDECLSDTRCMGLGTICVNTNGGYHCECENGFEKHTFRDSCTDIDECHRHPDLCSPPLACINTYGSYECRCPFDQQVSSDNNTCEATQDEEPNCFGIFTLDRQSGRGVCSCPDGFRLEGGMASPACEDIDECDYGDMACGSAGDNMKCVNTYGGHQCVDTSCPEGYTRDGEHNMCIHKKMDKKACLESLANCVKSWDEPTSLSYRWVSMRSNISLVSPTNPIVLYSLSGLDGDNYHFNLTVLNVTASDGVVPLERAVNLRMGDKSDNEESNHDDPKATLYLINPLNGPQQVKLSIDVSHEKHAQLKVLHRAIVYLFVAKYDGTGFNTA